MLDANKWQQFGEQGLDIKGITVHNTNSPLNARQLFEYLNNESASSNGTHFFVDKNEVIEVMPLDWRVWHTGKGNDWSFNHTISVEICNSQDSYEDYMTAQNRAIELIKELMNEHNLTKDDIYFHCDFDHVFHCPHRILEIYKNKETFIKENFE